MLDPPIDHTLKTLLDMVGIYASPEGWWVKTEARLVPPSAGQPYRVKYSLTLHARNGTRILGYDNAHAIAAHRRVEWDHKHQRERVWPYSYESAAKLLADFYSDVDRWLKDGE